MQFWGTQVFERSPAQTGAGREKHTAMRADSEGNEERDAYLNIQVRERDSHREMGSFMTPSVLPKCEMLKPSAFFPNYIPPRLKASVILFVAGCDLTHSLHFKHHLDW